MSFMSLWSLSANGAPHIEVAILQDEAPRAAFASLLDTLDATYPQNRGNFLQLNETSLGSKL